MKVIAKNEIKKLVASGKIEQAIDHFFSYMDQLPNPQAKPSVVKPFFNKLALISGRLNDIKSQELLNIIEPQPAIIQKNKVNHAFINFVDSLPNYFWDLNTLKKANDNLLKTSQEEVKGKVNFKYDIFLCYSSRDSKEAMNNFQKLKSLGFSVFFSEESLKGTAGISYINSIQEALINSQNFILLSTGNSMTSEWVEAEYQTFFNECYLTDKQKRKFIILKGEDFDFQKIPPLFKRIQFAEDINILSEILSSKASLLKTQVEKKNEMPLWPEKQISSSPNSCKRKKNILDFRNEYLLIIIFSMGFFIPIQKLVSGGIWLQLWFYIFCLTLSLLLVNKKNTWIVMTLYIVFGIFGFIVPVARMNFFYDGWALYFVIVYFIFLFLVFVLNRLNIERQSNS